MKITLFVAGSRGDMQPCIALCRGLRTAGYDISIAAPEDFAAFVGQSGVPFRPLRGNMQEIMASDTARRLMESGGGNPLRSIRAVRTLIAPVVLQMAQDLHAACQDADAFFCLGVFAAFGQAIAESRRIPIVHVEPAPLLPTRAFAAPSWPIQRNLGALHNYVSGWLMLYVMWLWYRPFVNAFRHQLGLPKYSAAQLHHALRSAPMLSAYSPTLIPHPADWPTHLHITGYYFLDEEADWQPPAALKSFLEAGHPPVYIGFGSMAGRNPEHITRLVLEALKKSGQRGLLLTGWGGLHAETIPESVFVADAVPHSWLFPRMAAVVHHGGAGTTAAGLRAGLPTVITPFAFDQAFWGARIHALGLGPRPLPQKQLTADALAEAIHRAVSDAGIRQRAAACGVAIRAENGIARAVAAVQQHLGAP